MSLFEGIAPHRHGAASIAANHAFMGLQFQSEIVLTKESFDGLPGKFRGRAHQLLALFESRLGSDLPASIGKAVQDIWFDALYLAFIEDRCSPEAWETGEGHTERIDATLGLIHEFGGWASLFMESREGLRAQMPGAPTFSRFSALDCLALYWFSEASRHLSKGDISEALDWIFEASEALELCYGGDIWDSAVELFDIPDRDFALKAARSKMARGAAHVRHRENRALKEEAFKWLDNNFLGCKSMDAAAEAMAGKVVPVAFRTARDWVGAWKKQRPASTP